MKLIRVKCCDKMNQAGYKFYCLLPNKKIYSGWEYKEDAIESNEDVPVKWKGKIITKKGLLNKGIDPNDDRNWIR